jgi:hypothetical protein
MKKFLLLTVFISSFALAVFAQHDGKIKVTVGPELGFATGSYSNSYSISYGITGQLEIKLNDKLSGTATSGIIFFNGKSLGDGTKNTGLNVIPIRVGAKYYLVSGVYGAFQAGVGFLNKGGSAFAYSPQLGYEFITKGGKGIDLAFKYDGYVNSVSGLALRIALVL